MLSYEEFAKNPNKYRRSPERLLSSVDRGSQLIGGYVQKQVYEVEGYACETLEQVESMAKNMGISLRELRAFPEILPETSYKAKLLVRFLGPDSYRKRQAW
jgi:hypothetical protein